MLSTSSSAVRRSQERRGFKVFHKGLILVLTPLLIEIVFISCLAFLLLQLDSESVRETRYRRIAASCAKIIVLSNDSIVSILAYIHSGSSLFASVYELDSRQIEQRLKALPQISKGDTLCQKASKQLIDCENDIRPLLDTLYGHAKEGMRAIEAIGAINETRDKLNEIREQNLERMSSVSKLLEKIAESSNQRQLQLEQQQAQVLKIGFALNLFACFALLLFYRQSIYQRLMSVKENTLKLADSLPLGPVLKGGDEIARLDEAFHDMQIELKEAAERENSLFQNASDIICVLDDELVFEKINPASEKLWGRQPKYLIGKSLDSLLSKEDLQASRAAFAQAIEKGEAADIEVKLSHPNGKILDSLWSTYYSKQEKRLYCIVHDITERKFIEEMKRSFINLMSSDLRLPLTKIADNVNELVEKRQTELSSAGLEKLSMMRGNLGRLLRLVNDLLEMVQISAGKISSHKLEQEVEPLLRQCVMELESVAKKQQVKFEVICAARSWFVDQNRIMQVIANLSSNAVKFSPRGASVSLTAKLLDDGFVEVRVVDQGRGVPAAYQKSIFEKFKQVEAADGKRKSGTGLGLPICKEIVEEHAGAIGVISEEGKGSSFWFRVPASAQKFEELEEKRIEESKKQQLKPLPEASIALPNAQEKQNLLSSLGRRLSLMQKGILLVGVPLLFEIAFVGSISALMEQTSKNNAEELRQRQIAANAYKLQNAYFYVALLGVKTHSIEHWQDYDSTTTEIGKAAETLDKLLRDDASMRPSWLGVAKLNGKFLSQINICRREFASKGFSTELADELMPKRYEAFSYAVAIRKKLNKIVDDAEKKQFVSPEKQQRLRHVQGILLFLGLCANVGASLFLVRFFSSDITARLAIQADNASRLARDVPLNSVVPGRDEIAQLDVVFHQTAEKLADARRKERAVFDNSRDLVCVLDQDTRILTINPVAEELLSFAREELLESNLLDLLEEQDKESCIKLLNDDLSSGKQVELCLRRNEGRALYLLFSFARAPGEERIYCIGHDISDRKELEQLKQDFLSVVSHDLRTPLTSVNLAANLIEEGVTGPVGKSALPLVHDISVQGEQLIELINDLLDLEKLEARKMELVCTEKPASQLIEPALALVEERFSEMVFIAKSRKSDAVIFCDTDRIAQSFTYILSYIAAISTPESDIYIQAEDLGRTFSWRITHTGQVLGLQEAEQLFDRFGALDSRRRPKAGQLSILAMPLARSIIEAHCGQIKVQATAEGNIFCVELPLAVREASAR